MALCDASSQGYTRSSRAVGWHYICTLYRRRVPTKLHYPHVLRVVSHLMRSVQKPLVFYPWFATHTFLARQAISASDMKSKYTIKASSETLGHRWILVYIRDHPVEQFIGGWARELFGSEKLKLLAKPPLSLWRETVTPTSQSESSRILSSLCHHPTILLK